MADPVTVLTAGTIASLAFQEFVKSGSGELAKRFTGEAIVKMGQLRDLIWQKLKGNPDAEEALEKVQAGSEEEISDVTTYLKSAMKNDQDFAGQVQAIAQEINVGKLDISGSQATVASGGSVAIRGNDNSISIIHIDKQSISDTSEARTGKKLSEAAVHLLTMARDSHDATIFKVDTAAGIFLQVNSERFPQGENYTAQEKALWMGAFKDLRSFGFIENTNGNGKSFEVTHDGFEYVAKQESPKSKVNMELSGNQAKQLREALQSAFPEKSKLKLLVREELDRNLDEIVGGGNLSEIVAELITFAEAEGRLAELVNAAFQRNPGNPTLRLFAESVGLLPSELKPTTSTTVGTGVVSTSTSPKTEQNPEASATASVSSEPIEIFISYSHKDDDLREELVIHLSNLRRQGKISAWHDRAIEAGSEWETQIKAKLESAQIILLLVSPPFMASNYCYDLEMQRAIQRHNEGTARVIPIILRPVDWKDTPFSKLQALPKEAKPVTQWGDHDAAFLDVVNGIRKAVDYLAKK